MIYHSKLQQVSLKRCILPLLPLFSSLWLLQQSSARSSARQAWLWVRLQIELFDPSNPLKLAGSGSIMSSFHDDHDTHSVSISCHKFLISYLNIPHHMICTYVYIYVYIILHIVCFLPIYTSLPFLKFQIQRVGFILDNQLHIQLPSVTLYTCCQRANSRTYKQAIRADGVELRCDAHQPSTGPLEL